MGSTHSKLREDDSEAEVAASAAISEAAATGASQGLRGAISTAQEFRRVAANTVQELAESARRRHRVAANASHAVTEEEAPAGRVAGVLSLVNAQTAAADGAVHGIAALERHLEPSASRFACVGRRFYDDITRAEGAAAAGAAAGVKVVALMMAQNVPGAAEAAATEGFDAEQMLAAARAGARAGSLATRLHVTSTTHPARYTSLLGPLLGGSLPASAAIYHLVSSSSDSVRLLSFGSIAVGVFCVSSGFIVGSLGSSRRSVTYCRLATFATFIILWLFFIFGLCTLFHHPGHRYWCGSVGVVIVIAFVGAWIYNGW